MSQTNFETDSMPMKTLVCKANLPLGSYPRTCKSKMPQIIEVNIMKSRISCQHLPSCEGGNWLILFWRKELKMPFLICAVLQWTITLRTICLLSKETKENLMICQSLKTQKSEPPLQFRKKYDSCIILNIMDNHLKLTQEDVIPKKTKQPPGFTAAKVVKLSWASQQQEVIPSAHKMCKTHIPRSL